ncbi:MAG: recombinase family protein, partial [Candidatus Aminicenantes bacterium]
MREKKLELAVGYCRVSTKKQEKKGLSLDAQEDYIRNWVSGNGHDLVKVFKVQESGGDSERRHLRSAFDYCTENGIKNILITDSDRWTRDRKLDIKFREILEKRELVVHIISENKTIPHFESAMAEFAHNIHTDASDYFKAEVRRKILFGLKKKLEKNEYPAALPLGYKSISKTENTPHRIIQTEDAPKVKQLLELFNTGKYTIRQAVDLAKDIALKPKKKDTFTKGALAKTIKSRFYHGEFEYSHPWINNGEPKIYENKTAGFEPIISKKTWKQNQEIIEKRTKNFKGRGLSFLFNQLMKCGKCERAIHGVKFDHTASWKTKKGMNEKKYTYQPRYVCTRGNYYLYKGTNLIPKEYVDEKELAVKENIFFTKDEKTGKSKIRFKEGTPLTTHKCDMPSFNEAELEKMVMKEIGLIKFNRKHWEKIKKDLFKDETKEFLDFEIRELRSEATNNEIKLDRMYDDYQ